MAELVFPNLYQVKTYLNEQGFPCSYKKLKRAVDVRELVDRRGGGWSRQTVDQYARAYLKRAVDASPELDTPSITPESVGAADRKIESQATILDIQAKQKSIELAERVGRLTKTAVVEAELGERARAFRLGLERFGLEKAEQVAELFGGSRRQAEELARRLGIADGEEAERAVMVIIDFCMQRSGVFPRFFAGQVDTFLDAYATGNWWTEEMREAWELYEAHANEDIPEVDCEL